MLGPNDIRSRGWPELLGSDIAVTCVDGRARRYVNLDNAASTPMMREVWNAVEDFMPWYSSVHRGSGMKSQVATAAFEEARETVAMFVGASRDGTVVFVRNTTEAINVLSASLPAGTAVLSTPVEHHANMLPWRRHDVRLLPFPGSVGELLEACENALLRARPRFDLVAVTGASNVTGEVWPLAEIAEIAHRHGAELFVDAAQLAPHRPLDMARTGVDFLAFSGHKMYAPLGAGVLVSRSSRFDAGTPLLRGGGAIKLVTLEDVVWADAPERYEAGSPNVVGVIALAAACQRLMEIGMEVVAEHEREVSEQLWSGLASLPAIQMHRLWSSSDIDRVGIATFNLDGYAASLVAAVLSAEHAVGVRHGCFCAHPLIAHLLGVTDAEADRLGRELRAGRNPELPGAVRASIGIGTTPEDVERFIDAVREVAGSGPRSRYVHGADRNEYRPADRVGATSAPDGR